MKFIYARLDPLEKLTLVYITNPAPDQLPLPRGAASASPYRMVLCTQIRCFILGRGCTGLSDDAVGNKVESYVQLKPLKNSMSIALGYAMGTVERNGTNANHLIE